MIIAITGATGFIGKYLVKKHLELGDEVRILTRKMTSEFVGTVKVYQGNLLGNPEDLKLFVEGVDVLYHCAAEIKDEAIMFEVNVKGTQNLIDAAKGRVKRWVQLSSTGVYGSVFNGIVDEQQRLNPENTYEKSKVASDALIIDAGSKNYFSYVILRPSNVFGAEMTNRSLYQLVKAVDLGIFFFIGKKGAIANYVSVENVVNALALAANTPIADGKIFNVSDYLILEEFIGLIAKYLGKPNPTIRLPKSLMKILGKVGDFIPKSPLTSGRVNALTNRVTYSNAFIETTLNYKSIVSVEEGLLHLVAKYKKNLSSM